MQTFVEKLDAVVKAAEALNPGSMIHVEVQHDPDCPALRTHNLSDCCCIPIIKRIPSDRGKREVAGIKIALPGTESTGFSPIGHLTDQIVDGLRNRRDDRRDQEEENNGKNESIG